MAVLVLTTVGAEFDARSLARDLVETRVAACVNIVPGVQSVYRWEGQVTEDAELLLVIKTTEECVDALREELFGRHPYDVPEFVVLPVTGISDAYGAWLEASVEGRGAQRQRRAGFSPPRPDGTSSDGTG